MKDIEDDRAIVEAIRRERGRLSFVQLCRKYGKSIYVMDRLIKQYRLSVARIVAEHHVDRAYDRELARRQLAVEIAEAKARMPRTHPFKPGNLEWR